MKQQAPSQLFSIGLDPHSFKYSDAKSWRGPCPSCGGTRRFVIFTDHDFPLWHGYCDECGAKVKAWEKVKVQYDPMKAEALRAEMAREQAEREETRRKKLAEFTTAELWAELRDRMTTEHIEWWESQGVPEDIQRYLSIGFKADKMYYEGKPLTENERHSPAYAIPWFRQNFEFETLQYRLLKPSNPKDKYRFEYNLPGGGSCYYMADPSEPIKDKVIICEGAKKAIVTWFHLATDYTVIAAASNNTLTPALEVTKDCGQRFLILDPGSERKAFATAKEHKLKSIYLPEKIDDMVVSGLLDRETFGKVLRAA